MTLQRMLVSAVVLAMVGSAALADSISPTSYSGDVSLGGSVTIQKTVTVTAGTPTTSKVDVYFLADTTGSMYDTIGAVQTGASAILAGAAGLGDVAFAVGAYRDWGDSYVYQLRQDITTSQAAAQAAINTWNADEGGDWEEAELYALRQAANTTSWRAGSARILVWFGDAPGWDPSGGVTEAMATAALVGKGIEVEAIDVSADWPTWCMDSYGQATRIAAATGGTYYHGIDAGSIVDTISDAIEAAFAEYSMVSLEAVGNLPGVGVSISPAAYSGDYDRSIERQFAFDVTFTGLEDGTHDFVINALVDGGVVATETDRITVGGVVPEPLTLAGLVLGIGCLGRYLRRSR